MGRVHTLPKASPERSRKKTGMSRNIYLLPRDRLASLATAARRLNADHDSATKARNNGSAIRTKALAKPHPVKAAPAPSGYAPTSFSEGLAGGRSAPASRTRRTAGGDRADRSTATGSVGCDLVARVVRPGQTTMTGLPIARFADLFDPSLPPSKGKITVNNYQPIADALANFDPQPHLAAIAAAERALEQARANAEIGEAATRDARARLERCRTEGPDPETMANAIVAGIDIGTVADDEQHLEGLVNQAYLATIVLRDRVTVAEKDVREARRQHRAAVGDAADIIVDDLEAEIVATAVHLAETYASTAAIGQATVAPRLGQLARRLAPALSALADERFMSRQPVGVPAAALAALDAGAATIEGIDSRVDETVEYPRAGLDSAFYDGLRLGKASIARAA